MFVPLANFTHYSLQYGFSKPKELIAKCEEYGYTVCGITDMKTISGCVEFFKLCKEKGIKPILGMALDKDTFLFAKNKDGWKELIKIHSNVETSTDNLICVSDTRKDFKDFRLNDGSIKAYYYCDSSEQDVHQISVCSGLKITRKDPKPESYKHIFTQDLCLPEFGYESDLINGIINDCEEYNILKSPQLPHFPTGGKTEEEFLKDICREGWTKKITPILKSAAQKDEYFRRFQHEFSVVKEANLFGYFLIVYDIIKHANSKGFLTGVGRGCFLPDTRVKMSNGLMKNISDIKIGDSVIDCNGDEQDVYDTLVYDVDEEIMELYFGKIVIRCTKDHKFLTKNRGWVEAQYLTEEDDVVEV